MEEERGSKKKSPHKPRTKRASNTMPNPTPPTSEDEYEEDDDVDEEDEEDD